MDHSSHDHHPSPSPADITPMPPMSHEMSMAMTFTLSRSTPLFSTSWAPASVGAYAGTCIFLAILAILARVLSALRAVLEVRWRGPRAESSRRRGGRGNKDEDEEEEMGRGGGRGRKEEEEKVRLSYPLAAARTEDGRAVAVVRPWRWSTDLPRASVFLVQATVGYFLMLAVMTYNVGYFVSVLAGLFAGELAVGRFACADDTHH